jgi:hypothetical protein
MYIRFCVKILYKTPVFYKKAGTAALSALVFCLNLFCLPFFIAFLCLFVYIGCFLILNADVLSNYTARTNFIFLFRNHHHAKT